MFTGLFVLLAFAVPSAAYSYIYCDIYACIGLGLAVVEEKSS